MEPLTAHELESARDLLWRFWRALGDDDDLALLRLTTDDLHERIGAQAGFCERLRLADDVTPGQCRRMGVFSIGYQLPGPPRAVAFVCYELAPGIDRPIPVPARVALTVRRPVLWSRGGVWRVAGMLIRQPSWRDDWPEGTVELNMGDTPQVQ